MSDMGLLGAGGAYMKNLLDLRQRRQDIIASNIANADTPGYKAKSLEFEAAMAEFLPKPGDLPMARTHPNHLPAPYGEYQMGDVHAVETPIPKGDKNSVDLEQEMARMSANQLLYNYAIQSMSGQISKLKMVIDGNASGG
ncbi:MAG: flagellar basal body rod protein FlgB [Magnetococcales bacterium]|nr:flagellar basal body rod protein FlgB [Magnetococcales bacterium]